MGRTPVACRCRSPSLRAAAVASLLAAAAVSSAQAQSGALYRCGTNAFTNTITEEEAIGRHCAKIGSAEWVFSGSDSSGRQYTYNDRRTVFRDGDTVETWLQVVVPRAENPGADGQALVYVRTVSPHVIRCRERTISSGATYRLDMRDNSVTRDSNVRTALFPPPERVAETLLRQLCVDRQPAERSLASRHETTERRSAGTSVALRRF
ncbi:MAG: hypothetical protein ACXWUL_00135 [Caldimonas sp.]